MLALAKRSNKIKRSFGDRTFSIFNHLFLGFCAAVCIFPLFYVFMYSITPYEDYLADPLRLFPPEVTFKDVKNETVLGDPNNMHITTGCIRSKSGGSTIYDLDEEEVTP